MPAIQPPPFSQEIQEIISNKPGWLIRNGIVLILFFILLLLALSNTINYPEILSTRANLRLKNLPIKINVKINASLNRLFVRENSNVGKNQLIAVLETKADYLEILNLSNSLDTLLYHIQLKKNEPIIDLFSNRYMHLGEVQQAYDVFLGSLNLYDEMANPDFITNNKTYWGILISKLHKLNEILLLQKSLFIVDNNYDSNLVSPAIPNNLKKIKGHTPNLIDQLQQKQSAVLNSASVLHYDNIPKKEYSNSAQVGRNADTVQLQSLIEIAASSLKSIVSNWKEKYLVTSPIQGKINFPSVLQEQQAFTANQYFCSISSIKEDYVAEIIVQEQNLKHVVLGQNVQLKLQAYPFPEYGYVPGVIEFISNTAKDSGYSVILSLPNGLTTNFRKQIPYKEGLQTQADIIYSDKRLLQRFIETFTKKTNK